jgi:hypothetical protein
MVSCKAHSSTAAEKSNSYSMDCITSHSPQHTPRQGLAGTCAAACIQWKRPLLLSHKTIYAGNTMTRIPASLQSQYLSPPGQKAHMQAPEIRPCQSINHPLNPAPSRAFQKQGTVCHNTTCTRDDNKIWHPVPSQVN